MTYPPPSGTPDPYQPQQPYGQQPTDPTTQPGYPQPDPYNPAQQPGYPQPDPYAAGQPGSPAAPYSGAPYGTPSQPYPQQYPAGYAQTPGTNIMAILSLVFAFVFSPVGIVLGHIAKKQIKQTGEQGEGLATAGLVLSYIFTGLTVLACCIGVIVAMTSGGGSNTGY